MTQAYGCAATVRDNQLYGHYGSAQADMQVYQFGEVRPLWIHDGMICDDCIAMLKQQGAVVLVEEGIL